MCGQFNTQQLYVYGRCLFKRGFTVQREVNSRFLPLMGLRLIKRHFTFSCTRFLFIKGIHSISKGVLFSFIDSSPNVLKVVHLDGDRQLKCLCSQPRCIFYLHKWLLSRWKQATWQISCFPDPIFSERQIVSSKGCIFQPQNRHVIAAGRPKKAWNLLLRQTSLSNLKIFAKSFNSVWVFFSPILIIFLPLLPKSMHEPRMEHTQHMLTQIYGFISLFSLKNHGKTPEDLKILGFKLNISAFFYYYLFLAFLFHICSKQNYFPKFCSSAKHMNS